MQQEKWTDWYPVHTSGRDLRLKKKSTGFEVEGQAGSVSNMVRSRSWSHERKTIDGIQCVRFRKRWAKHNQYILNISFTLDEYKEWKVEKEKHPDQTELNKFWS